MNKFTLLFMCTMLALFSSAQTPVFPFESQWKYWDKGYSSTLTGWNAIVYAEASWKTGIGQFGYGNNGEQTVISSGEKKNRNITAYFRKTIVITESLKYNYYTVSVKRDDGVVVYLNGNMVFSNNMPSGDISYSTYANGKGDKGRTALTFTIGKDEFLPGINVIAAEVHNEERNNDNNMAFDLAISADENPPVIQSITRFSPTNESTNSSSVTYRVRFSEKVVNVDAGDFAVHTTPDANGALSGVLASDAVIAVGSDGTTYDVTVSSVSGNGLLGITLNGLTDIEDPSGNDISNVYTGGQTYIIDQIAPTAESIVRFSPADETTSATSVTFRVTFSEAVTGVDAGDFSFGNAVNGSLAVVAAAGTDGKGFDVTVNPVSGTGILDLDLKGSETGIADAAGNTISGGFSSGETYTIISSTPPVIYGFTSVTPLAPFATGDNTQHKPQGKVWKHDGFWWACVSAYNDPNVIGDGGMHIFKLDNTTNAWSPVLKIFDGGGRADCWVDGNLVHILVFRDIASMTSPMLSIEYDPVAKTYKRWTQRTGASNITFLPGSVTATLTVDANGRMWVASASATSVNIWYNDNAPYATETWVGPITIATGLRASSTGRAEDMCTIVKIPGTPQKIGVFWSNQITKRFGFRTINVGADPNDPASWSSAELPGAGLAYDNVNGGLADDHMNIVAASDGTLYCAVKTSYNETNYTQLGLFVRTPDGAWSELHPVIVNTGDDTYGTQPILVLNEAMGKVKVIYTTFTNGGNIVYKESSTSSILFGEEKTLLSGTGLLFNFSQSTHLPYNEEVVILATKIGSPIEVWSVLASDAPTSLVAGIVSSELAGIAKAPEELFAQNVKSGSLRLYPNPVSGTATLSFTQAEAGKYTISLYDSRGSKLSILKQGWAEAGVFNTITVDGNTLSTGLYFISVQTNKGTQVIKLLKK